MQEVVENNHEEDSDYDSDASDYEWERHMQELWREADEAFMKSMHKIMQKQEEEEEDPESSLEEEFGEPVSVARRVD